jgi:biopolymer transport protein ExbB
MKQLLRPALAWTVLCALAAAAHAQNSAAPQPPGIWQLFTQSFDLFTIILIAGSVIAGAFMFRALIEVRSGAILPRRVVRSITDMIKAGRFNELRGFVERDDSFPSVVLNAAFQQDSSKESMRDAAELAASEQIALWFRKIEPLNVIGNLGPLVGLAGTVWGMILAFTSLGQSGGQAGPADLSLGISKALFHTLLGLCLAIPCLVVFGFYRSIIDRHCTRAMVLSAEMLDKLPPRA